MSIDAIYAGIQCESNRWIEMACAEAVLSVRQGGGPFAAVIVQVDDSTGDVIRHWCRRNQVTKDIDPTAHAEVNAIRAAAQELGVFHLGRIQGDNPNLRLSQPSNTSRCDIYCSCEPCPMCYAAIRWAQIDNVIFAATRFEAASANFSDQAIYEELSTPYQDRSVRIRQAKATNALEAFNLWRQVDKIEY